MKILCRDKQLFMVFTFKNEKFTINVYLKYKMPSYVEKSLFTESTFKMMHQKINKILHLYTRKFWSSLLFQSEIYKYYVKKTEVLYFF